MNPYRDATDPFPSSPIEEKDTDRMVKVFLVLDAADDPDAILRAVCAARGHVLRSYDSDV